MNEIVRDGSFADGFVVGFQSIAGMTRAVPAIPAQPATRARFTPFLMGVRRGIERATGKSIADIED